MPSFDVKQISHIAAELVVFGAVSYYFQSRCNRLQRALIEDRQRMEEQDKRIEMLENQVKQLMMMISAPRIPMPMPMPMPAMPAQDPKPKRVPKKEVEPENVPIVKSIPTSEGIDQFFRVPVENSAEGVGLAASTPLSYQDDDADSIDAELEDELAELEN